MLPWSEIDTVMFDMDGTLLDLHFDNYFWLQLVPKHYSAKHDVSESDALEIIKDKYEAVFGTLNWYCIDYWQDELQLDMPAIKRSVIHKITVRPNVEQLLQALRKTRKRVLLITNAHPVSLNLKMSHTGIANYFHQRISSHTLNLAKENEGFWTSLQELETYDPARTVLFDDSLRVLRRAQREGIAHLWAIHKPDSQQDPVVAEEFSQVIDFDHIMPDVKNS